MFVQQTLDRSKPRHFLTKSKIARFSNQIIHIAATLGTGVLLHGCYFQPQDQPLGWQPLNANLEAEVQSIAARLQTDVVTFLSIPRDVFQNRDGLDNAAKRIKGRLIELGYQEAGKQFEIDQDRMNVPTVAFGKTYPVNNIIARIHGQPSDKRVVVVGAHYDTAIGVPGANDNGSGVAALLELAARLKHSKPSPTIELVFFANEEEPFFVEDGWFEKNYWRQWMGSHVRAKKLKEKVDQQAIEVVAMLSLETIGYYTDLPNSQCLVPKFPSALRSGRHDPPPELKPRGDDRSNGATDVVKCLIPGRVVSRDKGDFLAVVSTLGNAKFVELTTQAMRRKRKDHGMRVEGISAPRLLPGITWSDHRSFVELGFPAAMITDTAPARYPYYHAQEDCWPQGGKEEPSNNPHCPSQPVAGNGSRSHLNFVMMARSVLAIEAAIRNFLSGEHGHSLK